MRISESLLTRMRAVRDARNASTVLPSVVSPEAVKQASKAVWAEIRRTYNLPESTKFKVVLDDGPTAGEIRIKGTGDDVSSPVPAGTLTMHAPAPTVGGGDIGRILVIDEDGETEVVGYEGLKSFLRDEHDIRLHKLG